VVFSVRLGPPASGAPGSPASPLSPSSPEPSPSTMTTSIFGGLAASWVATHHVTPKIARPPIHRPCKNSEVALASGASKCGEYFCQIESSGGSNGLDAFTGTAGLAGIAHLGSRNGTQDQLTLE